MADAGDRVKVFYKKEVLEGILMPEEEKGFLFVKLDSGYNIGLKESFVKKVEVLKTKKEIKTGSKKVSIKKGLPTISILHTGGTIASKVDYETGAVSAKFTEEELLGLFPELKNIVNVKSHLVRNMFSEMIRFAHYNIIAKVVEREVKAGADGIIVAQGTDTLHYTSAALAFALEDIQIPVMVVGSQRSSDRGSSDAAVNLIAAANFIANSDFVGVGICMHENTDDNTCHILPATKSRKMHTSRRDTFRPINATAIAKVDVEKKKISFIGDYEKKDKSKKLSLKLFDEKLKIGLIKPHVNMFASEFLAFKDFDGLVIELFGIGHIPNVKVDEFTDENEKISQAIKVLTKKMPVVAASQTIYGRLDMNVYSPGRKLLEAGVLGNYSDMTPETSFIKLAWLLSNHKKDVKKMFGENLRGEISERTEKDTYLI
ncbi:MAG: Glu-tRNA(Gln) amidotransferase subunit GatD [archaeon]